MAVRAGNLNILSLCTGGGGLDIGVELALPCARTVCVVEREAHAVARLVEAMGAGYLAQAPVWSDVSTFRGRPWRGLVDGLIGGIPCQPYSVAGKREGEDDERDLWPDARRIINRVRPWLVLIENVAGMLSSGDDQIAGAARIRRDLAAMSYRVEIVLVRASEVGASHERARIFILAIADGNMADAGDAGLQGREWRGPSGERDGAPASGSAAELRGTRVGKSDVEHPERARWETAGGRHPLDTEREPEPSGQPVEYTESLGRREGIDKPEARGRRTTAARDGGHVADAVSGGHGRDAGTPRRRAGERDAAEGAGSRAREPLANSDNGQRGQSAGQIPAGRNTTDSVGLFPPGPGALDAWRHILAVAPGSAPALSDAHVAAYAGLVEADALGETRTKAETESILRGVADGMAARVDQLRMLGNGVVPLQAAYAIRLLLALHQRSGTSANATRLVRMMELP